MRDNLLTINIFEQIAHPGTVFTPETLDLSVL